MDLSKYKLVHAELPWDEKFNGLLDALSNGDKWSTPSIEGVVFENGCVNNQGQSLYTTYDLGDKKLVSFHWNIQLNNVPNNARLMTEVAQVPDGLRPINAEAHGIYIGGGTVFSISIYDNGRVEIGASGNLANGMAPRFTMFYLANK